MFESNEVLARRHKFAWAGKLGFGVLCLTVCGFGWVGTRYGDLSKEEQCLTRLIGEKEKSALFDADISNEIQLCGVASSGTTSFSSEYEGGKNIIGAYNRRIRVMMMHRDDGKYEAYWYDEVRTGTWIPVL